MKYKGIIFEITLSGMLMALAIALSFATFHVGGGTVYLVGVAIFAMPLVLKLPFSLIAGIASVIVADALNGWIMYTWISIVAYGGAIVLIWLFKLFKLKFVFIIGLIVASSFAILSYFLLEWIVFDRALAISDSIATSIQFAIVIPVVSILYLPLRTLNIIK